MSIGIKHLLDNSLYLIGTDLRWDAVPNGRKQSLVANNDVLYVLYRHSDPDVLSFNASSETFVSPKQVLEDIGREISHTYTVQNRGPSIIKQADVTILWPTRDLSGNYLLYLVDQPIVRSRPGKGFCKSITRDDLNPLGLRVSIHSRL